MDENTAQEALDITQNVAEKAEEASNFMDQLLSADTLNLLIRFGIKFLGVVILFIIGLYVAKFVRNLARKGLKKLKLDVTLVKALSGLSYWLVILLVVLGCLNIFGFETTSVAAIIGAAGLAIGLAFQGTLSNLAAGVMLLIFRPFKVGDVVNVAGTTGCVDEIRLFDTVLDTPDRRRIIIPNTQINGAKIENVSFHDVRRVDFLFGVAYEADIDQTRKVLTEAVHSVPTNVDKENSAVIMQNLGASAVEWECRIFCNKADYFTAREQLVEAVKKHLDAAGIEIPFPQIVVSPKQLQEKSGLQQTKTDQLEQDSE